MIDIHMLTLPTDRKDWKEQMLNTLPKWATVHVVDAQEGPIGPQRLEAFRKGKHPYVSFVDPDDWTDTTAWDRALEELKSLEKSGYQGVCTLEREHAMAGDRVISTRITPFKHHFCIVTRQFIEDREALFRYDMLDRDIFASPLVKRLDFIGYNYRSYVSAGFKERQRRTKRNQA